MSSPYAGAIRDSFVFQDDNGHNRIELVWWRTCLKLKQYSVWNVQRALPDLNQSNMFGTYSDDALLRDQGRLLLSGRLEIALLEEWNSIPKV
ncbi:hypothetical protein TNCV_1294581 [Trichonephila clavipes]|nr:hypothetical protein TNCV_1294581 [Trichonephila clavipes]